MRHAVFHVLKIQSHMDRVTMWSGNGEIETGSSPLRHIPDYLVAIPAAVHTSSQARAAEQPAPSGNRQRSGIFWRLAVYDIFQMKSDHRCHCRVAAIGSEIQLTRAHPGRTRGAITTGNSCSAYADLLRLRVRCPGQN